MTKFQQAIESYKEFMSQKLNMTDINEETLVGLAQMLGNAIFEVDASIVACSDKNELKKVKEFFLIGELNLTDKPELDEAIKAVCADMGSSNRKKYRVVFYYLLLQKLNASYHGGSAEIEDVIVETPPQSILLEDTTMSVETVEIDAEADFEVEAPSFSEGIIAETPPQSILVEASAADEILTLEEKVEIEAAQNTELEQEVVIVSEEKIEIETVQNAELEQEAELNFNQIVDWYKNFIANDVKFDIIEDDLLVALAKSSNFTGKISDLPVLDIADATDFDTVKDTFVKGRLGINDESEAIEAIKLVDARFDFLKKYRVPFYYLLTKHLGKEWLILQPVEANLY